MPVKERIAPLLLLTSRSCESSKTSNDDTQERKTDRTSLHNHSKSSFCLRRGSSRHSDDYEVGKDNKVLSGVNVFKLVNTHFTTALIFDKYYLQKQLQEYNSHISVRIAKWAEKMVVQLKAILFKPSDPLSVLFFMDSYKAAGDNNIIREGTKMCLSPQFIGEPAKATLSHRLIADKKKCQQESKLTAC